MIQFIIYKRGFATIKKNGNGLVNKVIEVQLQEPSQESSNFEEVKL